MMRGSQPIELLLGDNTLTKVDSIGSDTNTNNHEMHENKKTKQKKKLIHRIHAIFLNELDQHIKFK
jgi:hypothetical protein